MEKNMIIQLLFFFFINKPVTLLYLIFPAILIALNLFLLNGPIVVSSVILFIITTPWYTVFLINYYLLGENEIRICGISTLFLKKMIKNAFVIYLITAIIPFLVICFNPSLLPFSKTTLPIFLSNGLLLYSCLFYFSLVKYINSKIISECLKSNQDANKIDLNTIYSELRNLIVKKVIE